MTKPKLLSFQVEHMDPMGQGVSKLAEKVAFIGKTLPNEKGQASILKSSKGVLFAEVQALEKESEDRISPKCPHFDSCSGCHYLHTYYQKEIEFKENSLRKHLAKLNLQVPITTHPADQRFGYRNRIQLHYNHGQIGFQRSFKRGITSIKNCLLANPDVAPVLDEIIHNFPKSRPENQPKSGHVEIYNQKGSQVQVTWNKDYAQGGFTQINQQMHHEFLQYLSIYCEKNQLRGKKIWDVFGGNGNLGKIFDPKEHLVIDSKKHRDPLPGQRFVQADLFDAKKSTELFKNEALTTQPNIVLIDPPRSGFKQIPELLALINPEHFFVVSCHPAVLSRDLGSSFGELKVKEVHLFDFFPGTYHFETLIIYSK